MSVVCCAVTSVDLRKKEGKRSGCTTLTFVALALPVLHERAVRKLLLHAPIEEFLADFLVLVVHIIQVARALPVYLVDRPLRLGLAQGGRVLVDSVAQLVLHRVQDRPDVVMTLRRLPLLRPSVLSPHFQSEITGLDCVNSIMALGEGGQCG